MDISPKIKQEGKARSSGLFYATRLAHARRLDDCDSSIVYTHFVITVKDLKEGSWKARHVRILESLENS